jgi:1-aminocyclopropane-1-carboxylate deaminase/D-cysteine desulfhydrase-like pyridoxal-dependent ACC family enzyme
LKGSAPVLSGLDLNAQSKEVGSSDSPNQVLPLAGLETDVVSLIRTWKAQDSLAREATSPLEALPAAELAASSNWSIDHRFHCGGYARCPSYLREFILSWEAEYGEQLDPVYTGKLFYALDQMHQAGDFPVGTRIVALHTGGLQGRRGFDF